jgi:hypothetical protein
MKKLFYLIVFAAAISIHATAQDAPLEQYVGKFSFPQGSPVPLVEVKLTNGVLTGESQMGVATLQRIEADNFTVVEYNGLAEFKRNAEGKVIGLKITVDTLVMEGTKEGISLRRIYFAPLNPMRL